MLKNKWLTQNGLCGFRLWGVCAFIFVFLREKEHEVAGRRSLREDGTVGRIQPKYIVWKFKKYVKIC